MHFTSVTAHHIHKMDMIEKVFQPAIRILNRQIQAKTPARDLCTKLEGRIFALDVTDSEITVHLLAADGRLLISGNNSSEPDVMLSGSPFALAKLSGGYGEELIRDGTVEISGDALIAQQFRKLIKYSRPDFEEELSAIIGDIPAHEIGEIGRSIRHWTAGAHKTLKQNLTDYLQEESEVLPSSYDMRKFRTSVDDLRDDVARFEARIQRLEKN